MPHRWQQTLACELRDYPEWHKGRRRYGAWVIRTESPAVLARMQQAREILGDWLHPHGQRQAHITLFVCGFIASARQHDDDFTADQLKAQLAVLQQLRPANFELEIGGAESFSSAAYLQVADPEQHLQSIRNALGGLSGEVRQTDYVPHLTLGLYRQALPREQAIQRLQLIPSEPLRLQVKDIHFATYEAQEQHGPLRYENAVELANLR
jgi:2'-5' RNA ligase